MIVCQILLQKRCYTIQCHHRFIKIRRTTFAKELTLHPTWDITLCRNLENGFDLYMIALWPVTTNSSLSSLDFLFAFFTLECRLSSETVNTCLHIMSAFSLVKNKIGHHLKLTNYRVSHNMFLKCIHQYFPLLATIMCECDIE